MIKYFCDRCKKEIVPTVRTGRVVANTEGYGWSIADKPMSEYILCEGCYMVIAGAISTLVANAKAMIADCDMEGEPTLEEFTEFITSARKAHRQSAEEGKE